MTIENNANDNRYIFWLFDWSRHSISMSLRFVAKYIRLDIDHEMLTLHDPSNTLQIKLADIERCEIFEFVDTSGIWTTNIKFTLSNNFSSDSAWQDLHELYVVPIDVVEQHHDINEIKALHAVVSSLKNNQTPSVVQNPYHRKFIRQGKEADFSPERWDATIAPNVYHPPLSFFQTVSRMILSLLLVVGVGGIIVGLIFNLFFK